jgi:hypothetical protein
VPRRRRAAAGAAMAAGPNFGRKNTSQHARRATAVEEVTVGWAGPPFGRSLDSISRSTPSVACMTSRSI